MHNRAELSALDIQTNNDRDAFTKFIPSSALDIQINNDKGCLRKIHTIAQVLRKKAWWMSRIPNVKMTNIKVLFEPTVT